MASVNRRAWSTTKRSRRHASRAGGRRRGPAQQTPASPDRLDQAAHVAATSAAVELGQRRLCRPPPGRVAEQLGGWRPR